MIVNYALLAQSRLPPLRAHMRLNFKQALLIMLGSIAVLRAKTPLFILLIAGFQNAKMAVKNISAGGL